MSVCVRVRVNSARSGPGAGVSGTQRRLLGRMWLRNRTRAPAEASDDAHRLALGGAPIIARRVSDQERAGRPRCQLRAAAATTRNCATVVASLSLSRRLRRWGASLCVGRVGANRQGWRRAAPLSALCSLSLRRRSALLPSLGWQLHDAQAVCFHTTARPSVRPYECVCVHVCVSGLEVGRQAGSQTHQLCRGSPGGGGAAAATRCAPTSSPRFFIGKDYIRAKRWNQN